MRKRLPNNEKTKKYINSLPVIYAILCSSKYYSEPFHVAKWITEGGIKVPLVYYYHGGQFDEYLLGKLEYTSYAGVITWVVGEGTANRIVEGLNEKKFTSWADEGDNKMSCCRCEMILPAEFKDTFKRCPGCGAYVVDLPSVRQYNWRM